MQVPLRIKRIAGTTMGEGKRRALRLQNYDYGQAGAYFVTVCVKQRRCVLGEVVEDSVVLTREGEIVLQVRQELPRHYEDVGLDEFVAMPNHVHGIVWIMERKPIKVGARHASPLQKPRGFKPGSLGSIVASFKSTATRKINHLHNTPGDPFWQRGYYDHIIRDEDDLYQHRKYVVENPSKWALDAYYGEARG